LTETGWEAASLTREQANTKKGQRLLPCRASSTARKPSTFTHSPRYGRKGFYILCVAPRAAPGGDKYSPGCRAGFLLDVLKYKTGKTFPAGFNISRILVLR